jgi:hypothetical protein
MATATAMAPSTILAVEKSEMVRQLHAAPAFADRFLTHMLTRNIRIEKDLIDQLFNSTEKRLARTLLLLARYGEPEASHRALPKVSQEVLAEMVGTTRSRVNLHEQVSEARLHRLQRRAQDQQRAPERGVARLTRGNHQVLSRASGGSLQRLQILHQVSLLVGRETKIPNAVVVRNDLRERGGAAIVEVGCVLP